jgi:hypothetical protein
VDEIAVSLDLLLPNEGDKGRRVDGRGICWEE